MDESLNKHRSQHHNRHSGAQVFLARICEKIFGTPLQNAEPLSYPRCDVTGDFSVKETVWQEYLPPLAQPDANTDVSVIIYAHNCEDHISRCIDSVFNQNTLCGINVIAVNCGSADGTVEILDKYKSTHGITVVQTSDTDAAAANNLALTYAGGKYVMFLHAADVLLPNALQLMLAEARLVDADIVQGKQQNMTPSNQHRFSRRRASGLYTHGTKAASAAISCFSAPWAKLFKRSLFEKIRFSSDESTAEKIRLKSVLGENQNIVATLNDCVYRHGNA